MKKISCVLILIFLNSYSQEISIKGFVIDKLGNVVNAHIINTTTKKGTFTKDNGYFNIEASIGDKLSITSINHHQKYFIVSKETTEQTQITIQLYNKEYILDEIEIKKSYLSGFLQSDIDKAPEAIETKKTIQALSFPKIEIKENINYNKTTKLNQYLDNIIDPTQKFEGVSLFKSIIGFKNYKREKRKQLKYKSEFPKKLLINLSPEFFSRKLKIPEDHYYNFIDYCMPLKIDKLYQQGQLLELIEILQRESKNYLELIKKQ